MIEINLLPPECRAKDKREFKVPHLPYLRMFVFFIAGLVILEGALFIHNQALSRGVSRMTNQLTTLEPEVNRVRKIKAKASERQSRSQALKRYLEKRFYWTEVLNALSDHLAQGIWLTRIDVDRRRTEAGSSENARMNRGQRTAVNDEADEIRLQIYGSVRSTGDETALIGRFISILKAQDLFAEIAKDIYLERIDQTKKDEQTLFDFIIACEIKTEFHGEFAAGAAKR